MQDKARSNEDFENALAEYGRALEIFRRAKPDKWHGVTLNSIGLIYNNLGQYQKAQEYYEKSLVIRRKIADVLMLSSSV